MKFLKTKWIISLVLMMMLSACGVLSEPEEASGPIEAVPLDIEETESESSEPVQEAPKPTDEPIAEPVAAPTDVPEEEPTGYPVEALESTDAVAPEAYPVEGSAEGGLTIFEINQDASEVRFELDEDLRGNRITVVGVTNQVAGQIAVNYADLSTTQVGEIRINARTLETDNNFRNRAIQNEILDTGSFEFVTFMPTAVNDLPDSVVTGDSVQFTMVGDLTIRDVTSEVTFAVDATAVSETEFSGTASATVSLETYGLQIPSVPNVANIEEEVELYINFSAFAS